MCYAPHHPIGHTAELAPYAIPCLEGLELRKDVGRGSYGVVYDVTLNGLPCIAKRLHDILINKRKVSQQERDAIAGKFRGECVLLSKLRHPNIVQFLGVHFGRDRYDLTLVMERMHMDLGAALEKFPNIPLPFKIKILLDVSYGLLHLHSQSPPVIHRDFTTANILLSPDFRAKVSDLGVAKLDPCNFSKQTMCPGAQAYMSPEALCPNPKYSVELDVFSFGHVALYTANQKFPIVNLELQPNFPVRRGAVQLSKRKIAIDKMGTDHCLYHLIAACLHDSPKQRPTTAQLNSLLQELSAQHPLEDSPTHTLKRKWLRTSEREDRYQQMADEIQQKNNKLEELIVEVEDAQDMIGPLQLIKQSLKDSLEEAQVSLEAAREEVQVKTAQLKQYKKQVDALQEMNKSLVMELTEVKKELVETKKQERAKSTTKELSSSAEMKAVPEEKYCKLEADFDQALAELQEEMQQLTAAYSSRGLWRDQQSSSTDFDYDIHSPKPEEPPSPHPCARHHFASPPNLMALLEPVVDYRHPPPKRNYKPHHPYAELVLPDSDGDHLQGPHHAQMGISLDLNEHRRGDVVSSQSAHSPVSPQQQPSPVSSAPLPGHAPSPTRPPLYQSQTAQLHRDSGAQGQVPHPLSSVEATFSPASQGDNDLKKGIDVEIIGVMHDMCAEVQAELVVLTNLGHTAQPPSAL